MKRHTEHVIVVVAVLVLIACGLGFYAYSGLYNIGADAHHWKLTYNMLQTVRDRSIHVRSEHIKVPNLNDPKLILKGAGQYAAMCTGCHLRPGENNSELRKGMYPQPPNLSKVHIDPQDAFWVIKHGIKMSAMPAWGIAGHDDPTIWSMVAFLEKLPGMTPAQYKAIVAKAPPDEDMDGGGDSGHSHDHGEGIPKDSGQSHAEPDGHGHAHADAAPAVGTLSNVDGLKPHAVPQAETVSNQLHKALQQGDRNAVLALLARDATISEGNVVQTRDAYAAAHLGEDIAFLKNAKITMVSQGSKRQGDAAVVGGESEIRTTIKGKSASFRSREVLKLKKSGNAWKIVAIHWQSTPLMEGKS